MTYRMASANWRLHLTSAQLEKINLERAKLDPEMDRRRQHLEWEPWKAIPAFLAPADAFGGAVVALAYSIR